MRLFELRRVEDESGVSGTGTVAQGVIFDNGWCALTWLTDHTSVAFYTSVEEVIAIHGHGGKTRVVQIADCDKDTVREALRINRGITSGPGDRFPKVFGEKDLSATGSHTKESGEAPKEPHDLPYELKELWEMTEEDRKQIYEYAMKRSEEIVNGVVDRAAEAFKNFMKR